MLQTQQRTRQMKFLPCGLYCSGVDRQFLNKEHMVMEEMKGEDRDGIAAPAATCGGKDP